jgi:hypothetical protein
MPDKVWMKPPFGVGEPKEVEATPEVLTPLYSASLIIPSPPSGSRSAGAGT